MKNIRQKLINILQSRYILTVAVPGVLILTILIALLINSSLLKKHELHQGSMVLQDSAREQARTLSTILEGQYETIETFAASIAMQDSVDMDNIIVRMAAVARNSSFEHILYVEPNGRAHDNLGRIFNLSAREYFKQAMSGKRAIMAVRESVVTHTPRFVIAVPIIKADGRTAGVIAGGYSEKLLRDLIISEAYGGLAYSTIYNSNGDYIIGTDNPNFKLKRGANLFIALNNVKLDSGYSASAARENLSAGKTGAIAYTLGNGEKRYATYTPLDITSAVGLRWFLFNVVPGNVLYSNVASLSKQNGLLIFVIMFIACAIFAIIIRRERINTARIEAEQEMLRIREEQFRIAATHGNRSVGRYDLKTGRYYHESGTPFSGNLNVVNDVIGNVPQCFIDMGTVAPESVEEIKKYFDRIKNGEDCSSTAALITDCGTRWFQSDATIIRDSHGQPSQAVIVYYDITEQREKEAVYRKWQQSLSGRQPGDYSLFRCNLSNDKLTSHPEGLLLAPEIALELDTISERTKEYAAQFVHPDDIESYTALLNADTLLAKYYRGVRTTSLDFREKTQNCTVRWLRLTIEMVEYPHSSDVEAYLLFEDIDETKKMELRTIERAETDPLTGVLNRITFIEKLSAILGDSPEGAQHAMMMLDIDCFKQLNDTMGHEAGDQVLIDIANNLRAIMRRGDLLGRLGGDEFIIFLRDMPYAAVIDKKANDICNLLRKSYSAGGNTSVSIGIAVWPRDGADFTTLYRHADKALYFAKENGKDRFSFYGSDMENQGRAEKVELVATPPKKRLLIVDDDSVSRTLLAGIFKDDFIVDIVKDGRIAIFRMRRYGIGIAAVLLDLQMPTMNGFEVLNAMRESPEMRSIPVIVVSADDDANAALRVIELGAADFVHKPVDPHLLRLRVQTAISRAENERLRAQNSYLMLQSSEEAKYRTVIESTGTVVIEYDWVNGVFVYDPHISQSLAGNYDSRKLWQILLSDMVASVMDVKIMQNMVHNTANDRESTMANTQVKLKTADGQKHWFRFCVFKKRDDFRLTEKMILTFNDINSEIEATERLRNKAERDELTGLYNRATFIKMAEEMIASREGGHYLLSAFDVDNFKLINDQLGTEEGDRLLSHIGNAVEQLISSVGGICTRISADNFAVLYPYAKANDIDIAARLRDSYFTPSGFSDITISVGRCIATDKSLPVNAIYDRAYIAKQTVKGRYDKHIAFYDESMRSALLNEQDIVNDMRRALTEKQFEVWLQPQYNHTTGALIGAEALVRWRHPTKGLMPPYSFIGIFERNGFIYELDKYVWEESCALLRKWIDAGQNPMPVSVNISRYDIFHADITNVLTGLLAKYSLPVELLRLEITETAFAKNANKIIEVVKRLTELGFTLEIDDFGSGYSSLNTLKDVPAQILKLDMRFLEDNGDSNRGGNILESIIRMAKWLNMQVIAEGVETKEQADFLRSVGCNYVQGYLYAKPMQVPEYEKLASGAGKEQRLMVMETVDNLDNNSFWDPKSIDSLIFNSYISGACIFEYQNGRIELLRANSKYVQVIGSAGMSIEDALKLRWEEHLDKPAHEALTKAVAHSIKTKDEVSGEFIFWNLPGCPEKTYLRSTLRVIATMGARCLIYCTNENITAQREAERRERVASEQTKAIIDNINNGVCAVTINDGVIRYLFANERYYSLYGYTKEQFEAEVSDVFSVVHPDDRERVLAEVKSVLKTGHNAIYEYRCFNRDGSCIHVRCSSSLTYIEGVGDKVLISAFADMTEERLADEKIRETSAQLEFLNGASRDMLSAENPNEAIHAVLGKVLRYFGAARAWIFELNADRNSYNNTYELCAEGVTKEINNLQNMSASQFHYWFSEFDHADYACIDVDAIPEEREDERDTLTAQGIRSLIAVPLKSGDQIMGIIGVDDPSLNKTHVGRLAALGNYMSVMIAQRDAKIKELQSAKMTQELMNGIPGGFLLKRVEPDGKITTLYVNDGFCNILGMSRDEVIENMNKDYLWGIHPDDIDTILKELKNILHDNVSRGVTYRRLLKDGSYGWFQISATISEDSAGVKYLNIYYSSLSEKEKQELDISHTMPFILSTIMRYSSSLDFVKDKNFNYICCSQPFVKFAGQKSEADLIGKTDYDIWTKEIADHFRGDDQKLFDSGKALVCYTEPIPSDDGIQHYSVTSKFILRDTKGEIIGLYGTGRDVTEDMMTEERLRAREQELEVAMSQMGKMILLYDITTHTLTMPELYAKRHGVSSVMKDIPNSFAKYGILHENDAEGYSAFYKAILSGQKHCEASAAFICKDGTILKEHATSITIFDSAGTPIRAVIAVEQID